MLKYLWILFICLHKFYIIIPVVVFDLSEVLKTVAELVSFKKDGFDQQMAASD